MDIFTIFTLVIAVIGVVIISYSLVLAIQINKDINRRVARKEPANFTHFKTKFEK